MKNLKVVSVGSERIQFNGDISLYSEHDQDCCESHYLHIADLSLEDFEGLEFDLSDDLFFKRVEGFGIELIPTNGHPIRIPGYGYNNGYYSSDLDLVIAGRDFKRIYNITTCQEIHE
jgi:hypothetical protein